MASIQAGRWRGEGFIIGMGKAKVVTEACTAMRRVYAQALAAGNPVTRC